MSKYENAKRLKSTRARLEKRCDGCGAIIKKGEEYCKESLGSMMKPPGLKLRRFCKACRECQS